MRLSSSICTLGRNTQLVARGKLFFLKISLFFFSTNQGYHIRYESEFHIVHKQKGGDRFAVVGIMLNGDAKTDNIKFQRLLDGWEQVAQKVSEDCGDEVLKKRARTVKEEFNIYDLIPASANFYHYDGSLTTPPCSEVSLDRWIIICYAMQLK